MVYVCHHFTDVPRQEIHCNKFLIQIVDPSIKLCIQRPSTGLVMAHAVEFKETPALYPLMSSAIKIASIAAGEFSMMTLRWAHDVGEDS